MNYQDYTDTMTWQKRNGKTMTEIWMFTAKAEKGSLRQIADCYRTWGGKKYQLGLEKGKGGYRHIQGRIQFSGSLDYKDPQIRGRRVKDVKKNMFFELCSKRGVHAEKSENWCNYEGKDGYYITSEDNEDIRLQRFGRPTEDQENVIRILESNNDREVTLWYDPIGGIGKSWLTGHLWEKHKAHYVRMVGSADSMIKDVASKMAGERRPYVIIDIPRAKNWTKEIYEAIEVIKDGLIDDPRYQAKPVNIRGVKVLVMSNALPRLDKLSADRWVLITAAGAPRSGA